MMPLYGLIPNVQDQCKPFELLEDHHVLLFVDFDLLPQLMQIMDRYGSAHAQLLVQFFLTECQAFGPPSP